MQWNRRDLLKLGGGALISLGGLRPNQASGQTCTAGTCPAPQLGSGQVIEVFPTSPLILNPFNDALPVPTPLARVPPAVVATWSNPPGNGVGQQDSDGGTHQIWPNQLGLPEPVIYQIRLQVRQHSFTSSLVQPIDANGNPITAANGVGVQSLPASTIYGFNGTFPGPMIYGVYGQPSLVRFENHLDENPLCLDRGDFGAPDCAFLTHLHNGHTAPESDGNPHYKPGAYQPGEWCDNLYLNWPPDGDDKEKQSFFWFHDHRMDHTGANVYKGMVGLYPIYDPQNDSGDERRGYRLPGVPTALLSNSNVDYSQQINCDIPLALYDCRLDDGATQHSDFHNGFGETHPEWWGKTFFRHFPNHGFVGDIFTVNGKAFPVLTVKRRRYRLRFLDASISRIYKLMLMQGTPQAVPGQQGQYNLFSGTAKGGQQCMKFVQIASEGGLLPYAILRDSFEVWPAKRREFIVDFSKYIDGSPTRSGDVIYLTNVLQMSTGRKPDDGLTTKEPDGTTFTTPVPDPNYAVPILKIVIDGDATDNSLDPLVYANGTCSLALDKTTKLPLLKMRPTPNMPRSFSGLPSRTFTLQRSGKFGGEIQWLINDHPFDPTAPLAFPIKGSGELWTIVNGGGGWVHPLHIHMEEHHVVSRNGVLSPQVTNIDYSKTYGSVSNPDPGDNSKEDVVALAPSESVTVYRRFRTFTGPYVCHCHNLAHEDHAMMFGWTIVP